MATQQSKDNHSGERLNPFVIITGLVGLVADVLSILAYLSIRPNSLYLPVVNVGLDAGLFVVIAAVGIIYFLVVWSVIVWRLTIQVMPVEQRDLFDLIVFTNPMEAIEANPLAWACGILNGLVAFPLVTLWLILLHLVTKSELLIPAWLASLIYAALISVPLAMALTFVGHAIGPLFVKREKRT